MDEQPQAAPQESEPHSPITGLGDRLGEFIAGLRHESHLICAIVATSYIDLALKTLLEAHLIEGNTQDELLKPNRTLGTIKAKGDLAYCLGFISTGTKTALDAVGTIRNEFAHKLGVTFDDKKVSALCRELKIPQTRVDFLHTHEPDFPKQGYPIETPRDRFIAVAGTLAITIMQSTIAVTRCQRTGADDWDLITARNPAL